MYSAWVVVLGCGDHFEFRLEQRQKNQNSPQPRNITSAFGSAQSCRCEIAPILGPRKVDGFLWCDINWPGSESVRVEASGSTQQAGSGKSRLPKAEDTGITSALSPARVGGVIGARGHPDSDGQPDSDGLPGGRQGRRAQPETWARASQP